MANALTCNIVSAEEEIYSGQIVSMTASGFDGEMGVQYGHAPLISPLKSGPVRLVLEDGSEEVVYVSGGYLEVQPHMATILADTAIRASDIDVAAAEQAKRDALNALVNREGEFDFSRATIELAEASAQLLTLSKLKKQIK